MQWMMKKEVDARQTCAALDLAPLLSAHQSLSWRLYLFSSLFFWLYLLLLISGAFCI
jgi:hypothetical protein